MTKKKTLKLPPFPDLTWGAGAWDGEIKLDFWAGALTRVNAYRGEPASDGTMSISISPSDEMVPPSTEQVKAFQYLLDNEKVVFQNLLQAVFKVYPKERDRYRDGYGYSDDMDEEEKEEFEEEYGDDVPVLKKPEELKKLIRLHTVHITEEENAAYVGFEFDCNWEEEHGLGVLMHKDTVVNVGPADVAFSSPEDEDDDEDKE